MKIVNLLASVLFIGGTLISASIEATMPVAPLPRETTNKINLILSKYFIFGQINGEGLRQQIDRAGATLEAFFEQQKQEWTSQQGRKILEDKKIEDSEDSENIIWGALINDAEGAAALHYLKALRKEDGNEILYSNSHKWRVIMTGDLSNDSMHLAQILVILWVEYHGGGLFKEVEICSNESFKDTDFWCIPKNATSLVLDGYLLGEAGVERLVSVLLQLRGLRELHITEDEIDDKAIRSIVGALSPNVRDIYVKGNRITEETLADLKKQLAGKCTLHW